MWLWNFISGTNTNSLATTSDGCSTKCPCSESCECRKNIGYTNLNESDKTQLHNRNGNALQQLSRQYSESSVEQSQNRTVTSSTKKLTSTFVKYPSKYGVIKASEELVQKVCAGGVPRTVVTIKKVLSNRDCSCIGESSEFRRTNRQRSGLSPVRGIGNRTLTSLEINESKSRSRFMKQEVPLENKNAGALPAGAQNFQSSGLDNKSRGNDVSVHVSVTPSKTYTSKKCPVTSTPRENHVVVRYNQNKRDGPSPTLGSQYVQTLKSSKQSLLNSSNNSASLTSAKTDSSGTNFEDRRTRNVFSMSKNSSTQANSTSSCSLSTGETQTFNLDALIPPNCRFKNYKKLRELLEPSLTSSIPAHGSVKPCAACQTEPNPVRARPHPVTSNNAIASATLTQSGKQPTDEKKSYECFVKEVVESVLENSMQSADSPKHSTPCVCESFSQTEPTVGVSHYAEAYNNAISKRKKDVSVDTRISQTGRPPTEAERGSDGNSVCKLNDCSSLCRSGLRSCLKKPSPIFNVRDDSSRCRFSNVCFKLCNNECVSDCPQQDSVEMKVDDLSQSTAPSGISKRRSQRNLRCFDSHLTDTSSSGYEDAQGHLSLYSVTPLVEYSKYLNPKAAHDSLAPYIVTPVLSSSDSSVKERIGETHQEYVINPVEHSTPRNALSNPSEVSKQFRSPRPPYKKISGNSNNANSNSSYGRVNKEVATTEEVRRTLASVQSREKSPRAPRDSPSSKRTVRKTSFDRHSLGKGVDCNCDTQIRAELSKLYNKATINNISSGHLRCFVNQTSPRTSNHSNNGTGVYPYVLQTTQRNGKPSGTRPTTGAKVKNNSAETRLQVKNTCQTPVKTRRCTSEKSSSGACSEVFRNASKTSIGFGLEDMSDQPMGENLSRKAAVKQKMDFIGDSDELGKPDVNQKIGEFDDPSTAIEKSNIKELGNVLNRLEVIVKQLSEEKNALKKLHRDRH